MAGFRPDRVFVSLADATEFLVGNYGDANRERLWLKTDSGLLVPHEAPAYLFRGECGRFPATEPAEFRVETYMDKDDRPLAPTDRDTLRRLIHGLVERFMSKDYSLKPQDAVGLLQHYGLPTCMLDFTAELGYAATFATSGHSTVGRICVLPTRAFARGLVIVNLTAHSWAERPKRQAAFGVVAAETHRDFKSSAARDELGLRWYEFPVTHYDRDSFSPHFERLADVLSDPTAGFVRHHVTEYVEAFGKLSPELTEWLLKRLPMTPRCYRVSAFEQTDVVLEHVAPSLLGAVDFQEEKIRSRRYWSRSFPDSSWSRMSGWKWPSTGATCADPRTHHVDLYSDLGCRSVGSGNIKP